MIYIPPGAAHQPLNTSATEPLRLGSGAQHAGRASCRIGWCRPRGLLIPRLGATAYVFQALGLSACAAAVKRARSSAG